MLGNKQPGFTFLEIIIVVAIVAILATFIAPNFRNLLPGYARGQFLAKLNGLMAVAWHNSVVTHKLSKIIFDLEKRTVTIQTESGKKDGEINFVPLKEAFLNSMYQWPDDNFEFKNFYIANRDELSGAFKVAGKGKIWYFITPDGLSQPVILNLVDIKDVAQSSQGVQFSLVLNPFSVQFKEHDTFQKQSKSPARPELVEGYERANGFSFIEVTLTIAIIGMMITSLFSLQFGAFRNVTIEHAILSRVFYLRNIYFDPENFQKLQKDKTLTQEISDPKMKMVCKYSEAPEKSEIAKKFENIYLVKSTGSWQGMQTEQQEALVTFVYVKPKEEKKTK